MSVLSEIATAFSLWIDAVAGTMSKLLDRFESSRQIELAEEEDGTLAIRPAGDVQAKPEIGLPHRLQIVEGALGGLTPELAAAFRNSRVVLLLRSSRFLFRPLDLPKRASEFLDGIVRAQIDRLTPWSANEAAFQWARPTETAGDRISTTIVATARSKVVPLAQAFADLGAAAVEVATLVPAGDAIPVTVYRQQAGSGSGRGRARAILVAAFIVSGFAAIASLGASGFLTTSYDDEMQQIQRRIAERSSAIRGSQNAGGNSALRLLERRKQTTASSVLVIDALSALLPDHTYATELEIDGDKLQISGFTHDAPGLISILEQSPHFAHATFFAPTTRAPNDPGERFHIEAKIKPYFKVGT